MEVLYARATTSSFFSFFVGIGLDVFGSVFLYDDDDIPLKFLVRSLVVFPLTSLHCRALGVQRHQVLTTSKLFVYFT